MNLKGHTSSSFSVNPSKPVRKVNAVISLRSGRKINNQVGSSHETCKYPYSFFHNSSPISSSRETGSSNKSTDIADGVSSEYSSPLPLDSLANQKEPNEKNYMLSAAPSSPTDSSSSSSAKKVHMSLQCFH